MTPTRLASFLRLCLFLVLLAGVVFQPQTNVYALTTLTVEPITWNVIGLDSNNVNVGPNHFPVGARVCNTGTEVATNVTAHWEWDSANPYLDLRSGTLDPDINLGTLSAGECADAYFEVEVDRNANAYDTTREYHIEVTAGNVTGTISTPQPRELYVEHLVSQNRNAVTDVLLDGVSIAAGGTMNLMVGNTYTITLEGFTATQGYEQLESFINIPNTIFQVNSVSTTYSAPANHTAPRLYANSCNWENDPNSPNYRSCLGAGKEGGNITVTYNVTILQVPGAPLVNPQPLSTLIYDFSGSSYHYNSDYGVSTRYAYILNASLTKSFSPKTILPGGTSTLTFTITNPGSTAITNANFTDTLPGGVTLATNVTTPQCGGTITGASGGNQITVTGATIAGNSICNITVTVTSSTNGTHNNTTTNLFLGSTDTGSSGSDTLIVSAQPPPPTSCTTPTTLATWTMPTIGQGSGGPPPPYTIRASNVSTATASSSGGTFTIVADGSTAANSWSGSSWASSGTPGPTTTPYFQFVLDTSNYGGVTISFDYLLTGNGDWASASNNFIYVHSQADSGAFSSSTAFATSKGSWQTATVGTYGITYAAPATGTGTTTFRINAVGAQNASAEVRLDDVIFTGCARPTVPNLSKSFSPTSISTGSTSTLTFTLANPNASSLAGVGFSDALPTGLLIATPNGLAQSCSVGTFTGATITASAGTSTITVSGGTLSANAICTISINVLGDSAGSYTNISTSITSTDTGPNTTSGGYGTSSLTVIDPPVLAKSFTANPIFTGNTTTLNFNINNPNPSTPLMGVAFTDVLPNGLSVANGTFSVCGGTNNLITIAATRTIALLITTTIGESGSCSFSVTVTGSTAGSYTNTTSTITSTNGGTGNTATANVLVRDPAPAINLLKQVGSTASGPWTSFLTATTGSNVYYRFTVENTGDVPLSPVSVSDTGDPGLNALTCSWIDGDGTVLVNNQPVTTSFSLPVADANDNQIATCVIGPITAVSGSHINTATASGTSGSTVIDSSSAIYGTPALTLVKSASPTSFTNAGNTINYSYLVTNSGFAPLLGPVTVTDDKATVTCPAVNTVGDLDDWLDVGESLTCTATYTIVVGDVTAGSVTNTAAATVSGVDSNTDSETVYRIPDFTVSKTNNVSGSVAQNATFDWTITVTNLSTGPGTFAAGQTILSDPLPAGATYNPIIIISGAVFMGPIDCSISGGTLACIANGGFVTVPAGASFTVTLSVTPTVAGTLSNTATVDPGFNISELDETNNSSTNVVTVVAPPSIAKSFSPNPIVVGGTTTLTFTITNPNTFIGLTSVGFTDSLPAGLQVAPTPNASTSASCGSPAFAPAVGDTTLTFAGGTIPEMGTCIVTVDVIGITEGVKNNTTGNVTSSNGGTGNTASDTLTVFALGSITITKDAVPNDPQDFDFDGSGPGGFTFGGGFSLDDDADPTLPNTQTFSSLVPGIYLLTESNLIFLNWSLTNLVCTDPDSGSTGDLGTATATIDVDAGENVSCTFTNTFNGTPQLTLTKTPSAASFAVGVAASYTLTLTNTGTAATTAASTITDTIPDGLTIGTLPAGCTALGQDVTCMVAAGLAAGANTSFVIPVTPTTSAVPSVTNSASVSGGGDPTCPATIARCTSTTNTPVNAPDLELTKTNGTATVTAGGTTVYTLTVINSGSAATSGTITVVDVLPAGMNIANGAVPTGGIDGSDWTCNATSNIITCASTTPILTNGTSEFNFTVNVSPTASGTLLNAAQVGGGGDPTNPNFPTSTTAGQCTGPDVPNEGCATDSDTVNNPSFTIAKDADVFDVDAAGDIITYEVTLNNTGNVLLTGVSVNDPLLANLDCDGVAGVPFTTTGLTIAVNGMLTCTGTYTVTQNDIDTNGGGDGLINNIVTGATNETGSQTASQIVEIIQASSIVLTKIANPTSVTTAGDIITYTFSVQNTGNVTLTNITLGDTLLGGLNCAVIGSLAPGASQAFTCTVNTYTVTQADIDNNGGGDGDIDNTATATGIPPSGPNVSDSDSKAVTLPAVNPGLTLIKTGTLNDDDGTPGLSAGDTISYAFTVTNTGNVTLINITLADTVGGVTISGGPIASLVPGAGDSLTFTGSYTITQTDIDAGTFSNTATVTGTPPSGPNITDSDGDTQTLTGTPAIVLTKAASPTSVTGVGDVIAYTFSVQNTGNVTLINVTLTDTLLGGLNCTTIASLAPGVTQSVTCTGNTYTVMQTDIDNNGSGDGDIDNTATVTGTAPSGGSVNDDDSAAIPLPAQNPALTLTKTPILDDTAVAPSGVVNAGDTITYTFSVQNTGNVTITSTIVTDPLLPTLSCAIASLAPGVTSACSATNNIYTLTQADVDAGSRGNTATATGQDPDGNSVTDLDTQTTTLNQSAALNVVKEVSSDNLTWNDTSVTVTVGDTVYYRVRVANTGNMTLTGLLVEDGMAGCTLVRGTDLTGNNDAVFDVGEEWAYTCSVTAISGTVNNTATADSNETQTDSDAASYTASAALIADPALSKAGNPTQAAVGETVTFTLTVTNAGTAPATNVVVTDPLPAMFDVVTVTSVYQAGGNAGTISVSPAPAPYTVTVNLGTLNVTDVVTITITTTVNSLGNPPINNTASLAAAPGSNSDPSNDSDSLTITLRNANPTTTVSNRPATLPATGFAPDVETKLPTQPQNMKYAATDVMLEIPSLGVKLPIVGVPKKNGSWDVSWLGRQAGWLEGSAFPSWNGNSVLTSHVYAANGLPGPFVNLNKLKYGDQIIVHAYGQKYIFEVQTNQVVLPNDPSAFKHEEKPWLTLITCKEYDEQTDTYRKRVIVRAVLVNVLWDK